MVEQPGNGVLWRILFLKYASQFTVIIYDEEENYRAYDRDEYRYYRRSYDDYFEEEPDFSTEYYVIEIENMLDHAEYFYDKGVFPRPMKLTAACLK